MSFFLSTGMDFARYLELQILKKFVGAPMNRSSVKASYSKSAGEEIRTKIPSHTQRKPS